MMIIISHHKKRGNISRRIFVHTKGVFFLVLCLYLVHTYGYDTHTYHDPGPVPACTCYVLLTPGVYYHVVCDCGSRWSSVVPGGALYTWYGMTQQSSVSTLLYVYGVYRTNTSTACCMYSGTEQLLIIIDFVTFFVVVCFYEACREKKKKKCCWKVLRYLQVAGAV